MVWTWHILAISVHISVSFSICLILWLCSLGTARPVRWYFLFPLLWTSKSGLVVSKTHYVCLLKLFAILSDSEIYDDDCHASAPNRNLDITFHNTWAVPSSAATLTQLFTKHLMKRSDFCGRFPDVPNTNLGVFLRFNQVGIGTSVF